VDDAQADAESPLLFVGALVAAEDIGLGIGGDADAGIADAEAAVVEGEGDGAAGAVVFDGVGEEIVHESPGGFTGKGDGAGVERG